MQYVIIGGDAAGMSAAMEIIRADATANITVLEKGEIYSYGQCGLPYIIDGRIPHTGKLIARSLDVFRDKYKMDARIFHEVQHVDSKAQTVSGVTSSGEPFVVAYDRLLIATGVRPFIPKIENSAVAGVHTVKTIPQMEALLLDLQQAKKAVVVGGGYIGLEVTETLRTRGLDVRLVQRGAHLMRSMPEKMGEMIGQEAKRNGVEVMLESDLTAIIGMDHVEAVVINEERFEADVVIIATGVIPNTEFIEAEKLKNGALVVSERLETSIPNIYAAGDCAAHYHRLLENYTHLPLGTTANKQGRIAGRTMMGQDVRFAGIVGTSVLKFFDLEIGMTGLSETEAQEKGLHCQVYTHKTKNHAGYYPGAAVIELQMLVEKDTNRLLGLQAVGQGVDKRIDVFATALYQELTLDQLLELDLAYAPPFNGVWDPLQQVAKRNL